MSATGFHPPGACRALGPRVAFRLHAVEGCTTPGLHLSRSTWKSCRGVGPLVICLLDLAWHWNLVGNGPHTSQQFSGNSDHHLVGIFAMGHQASKALAQPHLCLPADVLDGLGLAFESQVQLSTDFGRIAIRPRAFDKHATDMAITGFSDGSLAGVAHHDLHDACFRPVSACRHDLEGYCQEHPNR